MRNSVYNLSVVFNQFHHHMSSIQTYFSLKSHLYSYASYKINGDYTEGNQFWKTAIYKHFHTQWWDVWQTWMHYATHLDPLQGCRKKLHERYTNWPMFIEKLTPRAFQQYMTTLYWHVIYHGKALELNFSMVWVIQMYINMCILAPSVPALYFWIKLIWHRSFCDEVLIKHVWKPQGTSYHAIQGLHNRAWLQWLLLVGSSQPVLGLFH